MQPDDGVWWNAEARRSGRLFVLRAREWLDSLPVPSYPVRIEIAWHYPCDAQGLPQREECLREMEFFEDLMIKHIEIPMIAVKASCTTGDGRRVWEYHARDGASFMASFQSGMTGQNRFPIELEAFDDPTWSSLRRLNEQKAELSRHRP